MARDPGGRRNAHTLDAPARDLVECPTSAAKAAVRCPRVRADRSPADRAAVPPASAPLRRKRTVAHDVEAQVSTGVTPALGAGHPVDRVHRSSVPGGNPRFSPKISEVKATDQQRPAQAPDGAIPGVRHEQHQGGALPTWHRGCESGVSTSTCVGHDVVTESRHLSAEPRLLVHGFTWPRSSVRGAFAENESVGCSRSASRHHRIRRVARRQQFNWSVGGKLASTDFRSVPVASFRLINSVYLLTVAKH